jgi:hypothetical protein
VLIGTLEQMLGLLVGATRDGDVGWLRPLAVVSAEIEYSALHSDRVDSITVADECHELSDLLGGSRGVLDEFALRYRAACGASPALAALHDRALAACRALATRHVLAA